jgi:hypothetical protein
MCISFQKLLDATKSRKKQPSDVMQGVLYAEEEKRRRERENFHITSVPVLTRASQEPSLFHGGGTGEVDEERELNKYKPILHSQHFESLFWRNFLLGPR